MISSVDKSAPLEALLIDIGTGTQDILAYRGEHHPEACLKMVLPSPTSIIAERIQRATDAGADIFFYGSNMGGGPSVHALKHHLKAGLRAYATPEAATTFNDDLKVVSDMGVFLTEKAGLGGFRGIQIELIDLQLPAIECAFSMFGITQKASIIGVAAQDHGAAPAGVSDRTFRFEHLRKMVDNNSLLDPFTPATLPAYLTRLRAISISLKGRGHFLMDTGTAAITGIMEDPQVQRWPEKLLMNIGNGHTLAALLDGADNVVGVFEHHTSMMNRDKLDLLVHAFAAGSLSNDEVFADGGHGCYIKQTLDSPFVAVTGPKRFLMEGSRHEPYFAVPHGDTMLPGCFGLLKAWKQRGADFGSQA